MSSEKGSPTHPYRMHNTAMPRGGHMLLDIRDRNRERDPPQKIDRKSKEPERGVFSEVRNRKNEFWYSRKPPSGMCVGGPAGIRGTQWRGGMGAKSTSMWESGDRLVARRQYSPIHQSKNVKHGRNIRVAVARCTLQVLQCLLAEWHSYLIATLGCILDHQVVQCPQPCWDFISTVLGTLAT